MNYKGRLTIEEREQIGFLLAKEYTYFEIAIRLGRAPSTLGREVYRNFSQGGYRAVSAHSQAKKR